MHSVDGGLKLVRSRPVPAKAPVHKGLPLKDQVLVPQLPVLVRQQHHAAVGRHPGCAPRLYQQQQRQKPLGFGLIRHQGRQEPGQPDGLPAELAPDEGVAGAGAVALVEDEVDDGEHRREALRQFGAAGHAVGNPGIPYFRFGPDQPLGHGLFRDHEGSGYLRGAQAAQEAERQRHAGRSSQRRVAAGEDEPQRVIAHAGLLSRLIH
ncbi:hypothetical protein D9M72_322720 [compost metagenome]